MSYLQEGFNYPAGVLGNNPPWTSPSSLIYTTNSGLSYSNFVPLQPSNNAAVVAQGTTAVSYRPLDASASNGVVYFSFLINFLSTPGSYYIGGLLQSTNAPPGGPAADPLDLIDNTSGSGFKLGVRSKGGTTSYVTNSFSPLRVGTTYLLVMKYNFTNGTASMYLNPTPGGPEPASPDAASPGASTVPNLGYIYLRSGASTAGNFMVSSLRAGSTWAEVTPSVSGQWGFLAFNTQPSNAVAGSVLSSVNVQVQDSGGNNLATNVSVSLSLSGATFASGTTTVTTSPAGLASFTNLVINTAGTYTLTASASGFNPGNSGSFSVNPAAIDHYSLSVPSSVMIGSVFSVSGTALDLYGNSVTTDNSTQVTLGSSGSVIFDGNRNGFYGETGDNGVTLASGSFSVNAVDNFVQNTYVTAIDSNGKTGSSAAFTVSSNGITSQGYQLLGFLNSLRVDQYWLVGTSVNFLTGAAGGSGPNMTLGTDSHCSAFAASVANLLNIYMLRPPQASDLNLANNQADWFVTNSSGWFAISSGLDAQHQVNTGTLVIASYKSSSGSGHIAILRPSAWSDAVVNTYGPDECQSGTFNFFDTNVMTGFNQHPGAFPNGIKYYGHAVSYPISPIQPVINQTVITNQTVKCSITTLAGRKYQVQWSSNLTTWSALSTFTNPNTPPSFYTNTPFSDSSLTFSRKFYRVLAQ